MAISYVGGQVAGVTGGTGTTLVNFALTGGLAATPIAGDLVIVTAVVGSAARNAAQAVTTPTGYIALGQLNQAAATADTSMNVSYKMLTSIPDTSVTIPATGNNADGQGYTIQVFRGVDNISPMDVTAVSAGGTATGRPNPGSITPITAGAWIVICGGGAAGTGANYVAPANFTTNFLTAFGADTTDGMVGSGYWTGWTSGAVDPATYTGGTTAATDSWACYTLALRPEPTPATVLYLTNDNPASTDVPWVLQTFHPSLPSAKNYNAPNAEFPWGLRNINGTPTYIMGGALAGDTANTTQPMSFYFGKLCSLALAAQTIPVQRWKLTGFQGQTAAFGETYWRPCIYIWRPSTQAVVGYIADGSNTLGYNSTYWDEWANAVTANPTSSWLLPASGAPGSYVPQAISTQNGDMLVIELWAWVRVGQASSGDASRTVYYNAPETRLELGTTVLQFYTPPTGDIVSVPSLTQVQILFLPNIKQNEDVPIPTLIEVQTLYAPVVATGGTVIVAIPLLTEVQTLKLPAINGLGSPTSLYPVDDPSNIAPAGATRASNLPKVGFNTAATNSNIEGVLSNFWGGVGNVINRTVNAINTTANAQSYYFGRFTTRPLAAQTIPSQNWNYNFQVNEASANSNTFFWPVLYRWRPSDNTVDYIFNASANGGTEWPTTTGSATQNFSGLQITIEDGDCLVLEAWASGLQTTTGGTYLQTWVVTSNVSGLISPYKLEYLPNSILYFNANVPTIAPSAGDKATNLPKALNTNWTGSATESSKSETLVQAPVGRNINTQATVTQQSYYFGRHSSLPLAAQTIPAQLWGWEVSCGEINASANIFHWPVLYIWRPNTSSVAGYIIDASANFGIEWRVSTDPLLNQQFSGASVTTQDGDILVAEIWGVATQAAATSYTNVNVWTTAVNASLVSPYKLIYSTGTAFRRIAVIS